MTSVRISVTATTATTQAQSPAGATLRYNTATITMSMAAAAYCTGLAWRMKVCARRISTQAPRERFGTLLAGRIAAGKLMGPEFTAASSSVEKQRPELLLK